jgi:acetyltransferase-like isoleucine patch superfamily enzyme
MINSKRDWNALILRKIRGYRLIYFRYISTCIGKFNLLLRKVEYGVGIKFYGKIYFFRASNSIIKLGHHVAFRSDKTSNQIGLMRRCIISTLVENAQIIIGNNSEFSGVSIGAAKKISIGSNVMIGANCLITDTNWHDIAPEMHHLNDPNPGEINIGNNVFIGYGCIILKNVSIGDNSVIGAGSVVTNNIPANVIAAGNPCKVVKHLTINGSE